MRRHWTPSSRRAFFALAVAPLPPVILLYAISALTSTYESALAWFPLSVVVAEVLSIVLGGMAYAVLAGRLKFSWYGTTIAGGAVLASFFLTTFLYANGLGGGGFFAWAALISAFGLGTLGGVTFWAVCRAGRVSEEYEE